MYSIHHVALSVSKREISIAFYEKLGFKQVHFWEAEDKGLTITHLKLGDSDFILELFCFASPQSAPDSIHATATDLPVIGTKHFGLKVDSIEATRNDLVAKGMVKADIQITKGRTGPRYFFIEDPDGILVEIAEDKREFYDIAMKKESNIDPLLKLLDNQPALIERVKPKGSDEQSQLAVYIAEQTIKRLNMQDERIDGALKALHTSKRGNTLELEDLHKLSEELDEKAFDAQDADDDATYDPAFRRARAVNALEAAFQTDARSAIAHTLYETFYALDEDEELLLKWIGEFEETDK